ncbi:MAG TPA: hypothetical protein DCR14_15890 [Acidimicrobiaceae bacterium]|nr:hypothetical protein [Acidimicrobiaceae bacterium]
MESFVVRVWLPDRPGALGQVASRIGAVQGDVVGIEILERGGGFAIDELRVDLPDASLVDLLVSEIRQVDGVAVEDVRPVAAQRLDGALGTLATASAIVAATPSTRLDVACDELRDLLDGDWAVALGVEGAVAVASSGVVPDLRWLAAFLAGSDHLDTAEGQTPGDIVWCKVPRRGVVLACGRTGRVFHAREREEFRILGGIVDAIEPAVAGVAS